MPNAEWDNPLLNPRRRRTNPDGSNNIACKKCGRIVAKSSRERLATVVCHECYTKMPQPQQVPIVDGVPRPDYMQQSQDELLDAIFAESVGGAEPGTIEAKAKRRWSPLDLIAGGFKAIGFSQNKKGAAPKDVVYEGVEQETSKQIAQRKKRIPLFGNKK